MMLSLKSIIVAIMSAVCPVSNSFVLLTLVSAVYAVVGRAENDKYYG